jgi:hypothetical protein
VRRKTPSDSATTLSRDEYGIPHVYAPTLEAASYAIGYAQAEDRLEELLKNYRRAAGTMAEVFGPRFYESDLAQRIWRHEAISRTRYHQVSPKLRAVLEAYVAGVQRFMKEHPDQVPAWAQESTLGFRRPVAAHHLGLAAGRDRRRATGGRRSHAPAYRGSNEMLIAPAAARQGPDRRRDPT